ncbi:MAG: VOC family protein [Thermoplasmata archaeon]|jgi:predicted enzyme related to lactoylglutathione lyase
MKTKKPKRVDGLGGVFFRARNPKRLAEWYRRHLGLPISEEGGQIFSVFRWKSTARSTRRSSTIWAPFPKSSQYFGSRSQPIMLNYIVRDLDLLLRQLHKEKVKIIGKIEESKYGRFAWIVDPEGQRIELWEAPRK